MHGLLNITRLEKDGMIKIERNDDNGLRTPIRIYQGCEDTIAVG